MFAFVINPSNRTALSRYRPLLAPVPLLVSELLYLHSMRPNVVGEVTGLRSTLTGETAEGIVVGMGLTPRMIRLATKCKREAWLMRKIVAAVTVAHQNGATHIALTGQIGGGKLAEIAIGASIATVNSRLVMTSGNGLTVAETVAVVHQKIEDNKIDIKSVCVGVVGCYGSIGEPVSKLLASHEPPVTQFVLIGGNQFKLTQRLANNLKRLGANAQASHNLDDLTLCDVVIVATSTSHPFIFAKHLKPGAIVVDIAVPPGVDRSVLKDERFDVIAGGVVVPPATNELVRSSFDFGLDPGHYFACMAEIMLGRLDPSCRPAMTTKAAINLDNVRILAAAAKLHGFTYVARRRK